VHSVCMPRRSRRRRVAEAIRTACLLVGLFVAGVALVPGCRKAPVAGTICDTLDARQCSDAAHALVCTDFHWQLEACRGRDAPEDLVGAACSKDGRELLLCSKGRDYVTKVCRGPNGCQVSDAGFSCDAGMPKEGDACSIPPNEYKWQRCAADGKTMLACNALGFGHFVIGARCRRSSASTARCR
jgi:hypothetical protein